MSALRQLEFVKSKIDNINKTLKANFIKRMKDQIKMNNLAQQIMADQHLFDHLPE
jgi:uncharacterized ubiquitin-like protein YukD